MVEFAFKAGPDTSKHLLTDALGVQHLLLSVIKCLGLGPGLGI
jgi:hypothetical protein